jgi:16S rRNA G966 N2-methylase RsmD
MPENILYYGDNLDILRNHIADDSVDLVYLDPPFNSKEGPEAPGCVTCGRPPILSTQAAQRRHARFGEHPPLVSKMPQPSA